jgi:hypothetical protein
MRISSLAAVVAWLSMSAAGMSALWRYETTPGETGAPLASWPSSSRVPRPTGRPILVMAVHPRCPCSRATLEELDGLMARTQGRMAAFVLFYEPGPSTDWESTDLWRSAVAIPGVVALRDVGAREALRLGARTSGHAVFYDAGGRLRFSGGLTSSRGHSGWSPGADAILSLVMNGDAPLRSAPVFGCALVAEKARARAGSGSWTR